jgi:alcohol dehydrogenase
MLPEKMMALVCDSVDHYGLKEVDTPKIIEDDDVIGRVTLAAICTSDIHYIKGEIQGNVHYPRIMGHEFCVEVVETGSAVTSVKVGDRCACKAGADCGECMFCKIGLPMGCENGGIFGNIGVLDGCHAEYVRIPLANRPEQLIKIPAGLSEEDVVMLPDMLGTAWFGIQNAQLKEGETVAVVGCGPVGQCECLLAKKYFKASKVIAIDIVPERAQLAVDSGMADLALNPLVDDMESAVKGCAGPLGCNVALDTAGTDESIALCAALLGPLGRLSTVAIFEKPDLKFPITPMTVKDNKFTFGVQHCEGMKEMMAAIQDGTIDTHFMLTHKAPLNDIMEGYRVFGAKEDGCIKWLITPYER